MPMPLKVGKLCSTCLTNTTIGFLLEMSITWSINVGSDTELKLGTYCSSTLQSLEYHIHGCLLRAFYHTTRDVSRENVGWTPSRFLSNPVLELVRFQSCGTERTSES